MSETYSFSKLGSFSQCKLQYNYRYRERVPLRKENIEAFMGSRVHEALKELYDMVKNRVLKPKEWLLTRYDDLWEKSINDEIRVVKKEFSVEDYFKKGRGCLSDYYDEYRPFDQAKVVNTEEMIPFTVSDGGREYRFTGVIDRLDWNDKEKIFEVHDYKTSGKLMTQADADTDWQLPLYHLAVRSRWPDARDVKLTWHFLLFNRRVESKRTEEQLEELKSEVVRMIEEVESCTDFSPAKSALCEWCDFQEICPLWKHPQAVKELDANAYKNDPGVKLVKEYARLEEEKEELKARIFDLEQEQAKIEEAALEFAAREKVGLIDGPEHELVVTIRDEVSAPLRRDHEEKWEKLRHVLIKENKYTEVSTVNSNMLNRMLRLWPQAFKEKIKDYLVTRAVRKVSLRRKKT